MCADLSRLRLRLGLFVFYRTLRSRQPGISPGGEYNPATLTISIDKRPPVAWPHKQSVKIEKLSLSERHLIVLKSDGKRIQSFWFRFEKNDSRVCVALMATKACSSETVRAFLVQMQMRSFDAIHILFNTLIANI